jgi:hypothetical protein
MKGQISFVEYIISFAVFSVFVAYMFFRLLNYMPAYLDELRKERIRSQAYQLSEFLVNDPGDPIDWQSRSPVNRIGLSSVENKSNYISVGKVQKLASYCSSNYDFVKSKLGVDYQFSINILDEGGKVPLGSVVAVCNPTISVTRTINTTIRRPVAFDNGNFGELIVNVW